jgi:hypothetical protein
VIEALPAAVPGDRIEPLPIPAIAAARFARERIVVLSDGRVAPSAADLFGERTIGDAGREGLLAVWRRHWSRRPALVEPKPADPAVHAPLHGGAARARVARLFTDE